MRLLKPSNNSIQIDIKRWINQAFELGPKTWDRLIIVRKQYNVRYKNKYTKPSSVLLLGLVYLFL